MTKMNCIKNKNFVLYAEDNLVVLRKFKNRSNNICLIPLLDTCSFSRWCTFLKIFEIPALFLISSNCLLQPIKMRKIYSQ